MDRQKIEDMLIGFTMAKEGTRLPIDHLKLETAVDFYYEILKQKEESRVQTVCKCIVPMTDSRDTFTMCHRCHLPTNPFP